MLSLVYALVGLVGAALAQGTPASRFEVASVKPRALGTGTTVSFDIRGDGLSVINYPLSGLIAAAHEIPESRMENLPSWARTERFDIRAKSSETASRATMLLMLRELLADRFKLKIRREGRVSDVYFLTRTANARERRGLQEVTVDCNSNTLSPDSPPGIFQPGARPKCGVTLVEHREGAARTRHAAVTLNRFASSLSSALGRPVIDRTNIAGTFDIELRYRDDIAMAFLSDRARAAAEASPSAPTLRDALKEQLGLSVESGRSSVEVLIVDSLARPTPD